MRAFWILALTAAFASGSVVAEEPTLEELMRKIEALEERDRERQGRIENLETELRAAQALEEDEAREDDDERATPRPAATGAGPQADPLDPTPARMRARPMATGEVTSGTAFNPAISVILDGYYAHFSDHLDDPAGFDSGHSHAHGGHGHGIEEGFNLREAEVTFTGSVDPYFDMMVMAAISDHGIELEEAYITTRSLPQGLQVKAGKFFSDVGYINKQHPHDWFFVDQPWFRELIFGEEGLSETGVQLSWLAPFDSYTRFGVEVLEGSSDGVASYLGDSRHEMVTVLPGENNEPVRNRWRADKNLRDRDGPRLFTGFVKWAPDLGFDHAMQLGAFGGVSQVWQDETAHSSGRLETWDGDSQFVGADLVYKYGRGGLMGHGNFVFQAEYALRERDVEFQSRQFTDFSNLVPTGPADDPDRRDQTWRQDAFYMQGVYGFAPRWNAGLRVDGAGLTNRAYDGGTDSLGRRGMREDLDASWRYSGQVTYAPTEFSRLRAQVSYNDIADGHDAWQFMLQFNMSLGVHGAHAF
ncbi:TonB-dependent receptor [Wenzhouxiangella sp. AB-CW3]|uniref:TonB-dependent receptor n=1 Tax=Wenzhouxiangella sp. AB-CW3 TaxID=2771012 RepID=UPI00168A51F4|nr:TonB-dependent receptor [Wenzhouxiangella sp. AB-CW3]QOC22511.1 TonB-dependent receptor [Wenzhouxiangella sp. AB-CW3]